MLYQTLMKHPVLLVWLVDDDVVVLIGFSWDCLTLRRYKVEQHLGRISWIRISLIVMQLWVRRDAADSIWLSECLFNLIRMAGLLEQLLFVLEALLTRNYVVNPMHLDVWNAWNVIVAIHGKASSSTWGASTTMPKSHSLSLVLVSVLGFVSFKVFLSMIIWICIVWGWILLLNPVRSGLGGSLRNNADSFVFIIAFSCLHVDLKHLLLLPPLNRLQLRL